MHSFSSTSRDNGSVTNMITEQATVSVPPYSKPLQVWHSFS